MTTHSTTGIILHHFPYNDTSHIVHMLTPEEGKVSFIVYFGKGKKAATQRNLFQPMAIIEAEVIYSKTSTLHRIKEAKQHYTTRTIPFDVIKTTIALFIAELLFRSIPHEDSSHEELYTFVENHIYLLDLTEESTANFPLYFLFRFLNVMGFHPDLEGFRPGMLFDLVEGRFTTTAPLHNRYIPNTLTPLLLQLDELTTANFHTLTLTRSERQELLRHLTQFLVFHSNPGSEIKSLDVLQTLF